MADFGAGATDEIARLSLGRESEAPPPPAPNMTSQGIVTTDITHRFAQAVGTLAPGELVKDGFFTLFEAVAALEIMDPKMDSGCVKPGDEFDELYDVSRPLLPEEVLGIMDQLLCHEMSWHLGYPLSQTLFTSVYVEAILKPDPRHIDHTHFLGHDEFRTANQDCMLTVLKAYCVGMLKACGFVNERIKSEHYYEEEDFVTNTYNRTLLDSVSTDDIRGTLSAAAELLQSQRDAIKDELVDALLSRLEHRRIFLAATESPQHVRDPTLARKAWEEGNRLLPALKETHHLGKPVDDSFSVKIQRELASTMPPRPIVELEFEDALGHFTRLFRDGLEVVNVLHYNDSQSLQTFASTFQAKKPQPLVYVRTLLQTFLFNEMEVLGSMSIRQIIDDDLSIITLPSSPLLDRANDDIEAVHDPRFVMSQQMELFRQRAAQPFLDILRTSCQNRSRVRRTLCHMIRSWENLQLDAEEIDQIIQVKTKEQPMVQQTAAGTPIETYSLPLSSWAYLYKLRQMEAIVQMGFELEVYQTDELAGMYWYLNYLANSRVQHSERIKSFILQKVDETRAQAGRRTPAIDPQVQRSVAHIRLSLLDAAVTWQLSDTLSCLYVVLARLQLVKTPPRPYGDDNLRYELRMKPFVSIGLPDLPSFEDFTTGTMQPNTTTLELLEYAERALASAKKGFDALAKLPDKESFSVGSHDRWVVSVKNGLRSCIATGIAISSVQKAVKEAASVTDVKIRAEIPTPDKAYHEWWIVPKIIPVR